MTDTVLNPLPPAPLAMPPQRLGDVRPHAPLPGDGWAVQAARAFVFGSALALTGALGWVMHDWFNEHGLNGVEVMVMACALFAAFWIALSVGTAFLGLLPRRVAESVAVAPLDIAVMLPVYGEPIGGILENAEALLRGLRAHRPAHRFALYVLSDTRDAGRVLQEHAAFRALMRRLPGARLHYRHRADNTRYKAGNIEDWVTRWGGGHDAMLVLDADSVMSPRAVLRMADALGASPRLGLVQSIPRLIGGETLFARMQQFSNTIYGTTLARGLTLWSGSAANYWGHNALIRVRAFAEAARLPDLPGRRPFGGVILSHDFVEAAMLRRAGWQVRFMPEARGSFETTPETVIGHVQRDRRWCQGNLQHLRILGASGFHPVSRMHLFQGAMAYTASLGWFALMVLWILIGTGQGDGAIVYFTEANPMFPAWPEMDVVSRILIVALTYGLLIAPKILGVLAYWSSDPLLLRVGGPLSFFGSFLMEVLLSVLLAPTMMVQHMMAVLRTLTGFDTGWRPHAAASRRFGVLVRFHALELALGFAMCALFVAGTLTLWLTPIGVSLALAPVLSWATATRGRWVQALFRTPQDQGPAAQDPAAPAPAYSGA
ncbi:MAG: glucans biosynthesis glucosyltransferase MdoH [Pseudomonadota bacterium]